MFRIAVHHKMAKFVGEVKVVAVPHRHRSTIEDDYRLAVHHCGVGIDVLVRLRISNDRDSVPFQ